MESCWKQAQDEMLVELSDMGFQIHDAGKVSRHLDRFPVTKKAVLEIARRLKLSLPDCEKMIEVTDDILNLIVKIDKNDTPAFRKALSADLALLSKTTKARVVPVYSHPWHIPEYPEISR